MGWCGTAPDGCGGTLNCGGCGLAGIGKQFPQVLVRIGIQERQQPLRLRRREVPEIRRAVGES